MKLSWCRQVLLLRGVAILIVVGIVLVACGAFIAAVRTLSTSVGEP